MDTEKLIDWVLDASQLKVEYLADVMQRCAALQAAATLVAASSETEGMPLGVQANRVTHLAGEFLIDGILDPS